MKRSITFIASLGLLFFLAQGCVKFPEDDREPQQMELDGVYVFVKEYLPNNQPMSKRTVGKEVARALSKLENHGEPININIDRASAAVEIQASVKTLQVRASASAPGMDQGSYQTTLSVTFISNCRDGEVFLNEQIKSPEIRTPTSYEAAAKGAEWAAEAFIRYFIDNKERQDELLRYLPIEKFPKKKKATETEPTVEPES
ncbi:MAG: hypothetical protein E3J72_01620 [Planctomycetota bacterium]|nr:MAG: hypothetical protein E3J72_01620 [Planctomycetota bacterium]